MKKFVKSIFGGFARSQYFPTEDQYTVGIGIDPDLAISDSIGSQRTSGVLRPSSYSKFSSTLLTSPAYWIISNPKDSLLYVIANNGRLLSYSATLASETNIGTATSSNGEGGAYYNNYIYIVTITDISRYGPLDNSPSLANTVWTDATLGSQTALTNTVYPSVRRSVGSAGYQNHAMHVHVDNKLYFCDFKAGIGYIHFIKTKKGTAEGDTNDGSTYGALDLPFGFMPTDIESYGNDLVITAIQTSNANVNQGRSALFFWDTFSDTYYNHVWLPDPLATAMINNNGRLYVWTGMVSSEPNISNGYRLLEYQGGQTLRELYFSNTGSPPLAGAVESIGKKILWGTFETVETTTSGTPTFYAVVMGLYSKDEGIQSGVHCVAKSTATADASDGVVTSIKNFQQASFSKPQLIIGWYDAGDATTAYGLDSRTTTYGTSVWQSRVFSINKKFTIKSIRLSLAAAVAANMTITPKIFLDDFSSSSTTGLTVINNTNYANSERVIQYKPDISGVNNFVFELTWSGTALLPVLLPIEFEIDVRAD